MANIPDGLPLDAPNAPQISTAAVEPTDFGFERAAQPIEEEARRQLRTQSLQIRAQAAQDRQAAQPYFQQYAAEAEDDASSRIAADNGQITGLANTVGLANKRIAAKYAAIDGLAPGVQAELNTMIAAHGNQVSEQARNAEAAHLAAPIAQARVASDNMAIGNAMDAANAGFQAQVHQLKLNWKPGDPDLQAQIDQASAGHFGPAIAGLPDNLQPYAQQRAQSEIEQAKAGALAYSLQTADDKQTLAVNSRVDTILNTIQTNPAYFQQATAVDLPAAVAQLPNKAQQEAVLREVNQRAVGARFDGLIANNQAHQAYDEARGSTYDGLVDDKFKAAMVDKTGAALRAVVPLTSDDILKKHDLQERMQAEISATADGKTTGFDVTASGADRYLSQGEIADFQIKKQAAQRLYTAEGGIDGMTNAELQAAAHPSPLPYETPDYEAQTQIRQARAQLAQQELDRRAKDPAQNLFENSTKGPPTKGVGATSPAQQRAADLTQGWNAVMTSSGQAQSQAASSVALTSLGTQAAQGISEGQRKVIPQAYAGQLAQGFITAPTEAKLQTGARLADIVHAFPSTVRLPDGTVSHPQQILTQQLLAAGMAPRDVSAIVDYGSDPAGKAKLGHYLQAAADPALQAKESSQDKKQDDQIRARVTQALQPFLSTAAPLSGSDALYQARIDRTTLIARSLRAGGMSQGDAVKAAAADLVGGYRYVDGGWRMPEALASTSSFVGYTGHNAGFLGFADGAGLARAGAANILATLTGNGGGRLAPNPGEAPALTAARISANARWVSAPDDSGLMLMIPHAGAPWEQVGDRWGRPVTATWSQLNAAARGADPAMFDKPPPQAVYQGKPVPVATSRQVFGAFLDAITGDGEHGKTGDLGPVTRSGQALGKYQLMPATVTTYAGAAGLPVDMNRAQWDDDYGRKIAAAALSANLNHYATSSNVGAYALAAAAYDAGPKTVDRWILQYGDPRTGKISVDDWLARIPYDETRKYVGRVLPGAVRRLQQGH